MSYHWIFLKQQIEPINKEGIEFIFLVKMAIAFGGKKTARKGICLVVLLHCVF